MLFLLSPAKKLDETSPIPTHTFTEPVLLKHSTELIQQLRQLSPQDIANLMHISDKLALLNLKRYDAFALPFSPDNARAALFLFKGDVYEGIDAYHLTEKAINYTQQHTAILSGLYGVLRPLDLMQAYRLEMGTPFTNSRGKNLYEFWGDIITRRVNQLIQDSASEHVINLASLEYFKSIHAKKLAAPVITPIFKDKKNGQYKIISFYAKRARGLMIHFAAQNNIQDVDQLKAFDLEGYTFDEKSSNSDEWVFLREHA